MRRGPAEALKVTGAVALMVVLGAVVTIVCFVGVLLAMVVFLIVYFSG